VYLSQLRQFYWEARGLGFDLVGAANDTPETLKELRERQDLPFMLLADEGAEVAKRYNTYHLNEPRGRDISYVSVFLIDSADNGGTILWEHVATTARHRVAMSRLSEEMQRASGRAQMVVNVVVPSPWEVERSIAVIQDPPLGLYTTPEDLHAPGAGVSREYTQQLAMLSHGEVVRLAEEGWRLAAVTPEYEGGIATGHRYVFEKANTSE
jgi:alkyl hydroperoxide reductase subunit AhpC